VQPYSPHWIYEDEEGVFDPSPVFECMPPNDSRMRDWNGTYGGRILTISAKPPALGDGAARTGTPEPSST
jgi:hypothetical protein